MLLQINSDEASGQNLCLPSAWTQKAGQTIAEVAMRRRSSADARPGSSSRDAGLAEIMPGRKARFAGKESRLGTGNEDRVVEVGCQKRFLKRKMLKQVQTSLFVG